MTISREQKEAERETFCQQNPRMFLRDEIYTKLDGGVVSIMGYTNVDTQYETVRGSDGIHRYNRRDYGRCTGTNWECPNPANLEIPVNSRYLVKERMKKWGDLTSSMDRANPCAECESTNLRCNFVPGSNNFVQISCLRCGLTSEKESNTNNAVNRWNGKNFKNPPITFE